MTTNSNIVSVTVAGVTMSAQLSVNSTNITLGQEIVFYPSSTGCNGTVTYSLYQNGTYYATISSGSGYEPSSAGTYSFYVIANCSAGYNAQSNTVTVTVSEPTYSLSLSSPESSIGSCGGSITLTATLTSPDATVANQTISINDLNTGATTPVQTDSSGSATITVTIPSNSSSSSISWEFDATFQSVTSNAVYITQGASGSSTITVTFTETGLSSGTQWCVITDVETICSTTNTLQIEAYANSTYNVNVGSGWQASPSSGTISCSTSSIAITFSQVVTEYSVTFNFTETSPTANYVTFGGVLYSTSNTSLTISNIANGTYDYSITATYTGKLAMKVLSVSPSSGSVTVNGANVTVSVKVTYEET